MTYMFSNVMVKPINLYVNSEKNNLKHRSKKITELSFYRKDYHLLLK